MTKVGPHKTNELTTTSGAQLPSTIVNQMPDFMKTHDGESTLSLVNQYVIIPRVKVIQPLAKEPYKPRFKDRDVVATPVMIPLSENNEVGDVLFHFVPLLFYPEWITWNPRVAGMNAIRDRTLNYKDTIACKARSADTRREPCAEAPLKDGQPQMMRHLEHLNFTFVIIGDHELADYPLTMSFASGEHQAGSRFNTLISMRRSKYIYGLQFAAKLGQRTNPQGTWWGIDVDNPAEDSGVAPYVQNEELFQLYGKRWKEMQDLYDQRRLQVDMGDLSSADEDTGGNVGPSPEAEKKF